MMTPWKQFILKAQRESKKQDVNLYVVRHGKTNPRWTLHVVTRPGKGRFRILAGYKFDNSNPFDIWSFINFAMEMVNFYQLEVGGCCYYKKDLYRVERHFKKIGAYEMFEKVIEKTIQREQYLNYPLIRKEYENAREMLRTIRREIYTLFRYFTDCALKKAALSALGSTKNINNDTVKLQQVINRILNYHDDMAVCVDRIAEFERSFESRKDEHFGYYITGSSHDDKLTISLKDVLNRIDAARFGYYQRTKSMLH